MDLLLRGHTHSHAMGQRNKLLHDGNIEGNGGKRKGHRCAFHIAQDLRVLWIGIKEVEQISLREHHALGLACRTGGKDAIRQIILLRSEFQVLRALILQK